MILRSAALGAATGLRSTAGVAAVVLVADRPLPDAVRRRLSKPGVALSLGGELVADKLPFTPSRLEPRGLIPRVVFSGLAAALVSDREGAEVAVDAVVAGACALASARIGHDLRVQASKRWGNIPAGLVEDAVALTLAFTAAWSARGGAHHRASSS